MPPTDNTLYIAEIPYESGEIRFRYSRIKSEDGTQWIRHGLFRAYHLNGHVISEGTYENGQEHGVWRDYHDNGQLASEGEYSHGKETGLWRFWDTAGNPESSEDHGNS